MSQTGDHAAGLHDHPDCPWCPDEDEAQLLASIAFTAQHLREVSADDDALFVSVDRKGWERLQAAVRRYVAGAPT